MPDCEYVLSKIILTFLVTDSVNIYKCPYISKRHLYERVTYILNPISFHATIFYLDKWWGTSKGSESK